MLLKNLLLIHLCLLCTFTSIKAVNIEGLYLMQTKSVDQKNDPQTGEFIAQIIQLNEFTFQLSNYNYDRALMELKLSPNPLKEDIFDVVVSLLDVDEEYAYEADQSNKASYYNLKDSTLVIDITFTIKSMDHGDQTVPLEMQGTKVYENSSYTNADITAIYNTFKIYQEKLDQRFKDIRDFPQKISEQLAQEKDSAKRIKKAKILEIAKLKSIELYHDIEIIVYALDRSIKKLKPDDSSNSTAASYSITTNMLLLDGENPRATQLKKKLDDYVQWLNKQQQELGLEINNFQSLSTLNLPTNIHKKADTSRSFEEGLFRDTPVVLALLIITHKNLQAVEYGHQMMYAMTE